MTSSPRVAIIGARGIGRHHGYWWHLSGAEVCAHVGRTAESVKSADEKLHTMFGYQGKGYTDVGEMLVEERPDWVDVASNNPSHYSHVKAALEAGCNVLAEKPLVHDPALSTLDLLAQTNELLALADYHGVTLAMCSQFSVAASICLKLFRELRGDEVVHELHAELASPVRGRPEDPNGTWIDLGPHVLTMAQIVSTELGIDFPMTPVPSTVRRFFGYRAECEFELPGLVCTVSTFRTPDENPSNVRRLTLNGVPFAMEGENDEQGVYRARIDYPGGSYRCDDTMRQLIAACLAGASPLTGNTIRANQSWLLSLAG